VIYVVPLYDGILVIHTLNPPSKPDRQTDRPGLCTVLALVTCPTAW